MIGLGFQEASVSLVGNMIGANRVGYAWHYAQVMTPLSIVMTFTFMYPLFAFIDEIALLFTDGSELKDKLMDVLPILFICFFFDVLQSLSKGVVRGLNLQKVAAWITIFCYYAVAIPVGINFAFNR